MEKSDFVMALEEGVRHSRQDVQASHKAPLSVDGHDHNFDRGQLRLWTISSLCARGWA